ncbi:hypothetical protein [Undibacterium sp. TS12]|uniref:hypothetical protein n=1 Tax=Undibacterium sp. TS12 TaxID=2908202 RepID=UPI001F4CE216|nr:hypothetical protein [Undibacterium sp. TS12]MCH8621278.1 hypothetical protein [Undibacterium sp. TS12]
MEIENACFYQVAYKGREQIVYALSDGVMGRVRFIEHLSAGVEESFDPSTSKILKRFGSAEEIWKDEFASEVLAVLVQDGLELDTLETLQLIEQIQRQSLPLSDLAKIRHLVTVLHEERRQLESSRSSLWRSFAHRAAI